MATRIGGRVQARGRAQDRVIARGARQAIRSEQLGTLKALIAPMALLAVLFTAIGFWIGLTAGPRQTWLAIGALSSTWFWLAVGFVLLLSGTWSRVIGLEAQDWTSGALRPLARTGWRTVAGIPLLGNGDVDHVVVGPAGIIAIETKWCQRWTSGRYVKDQLAWAATQAGIGVKQARALLTREQRAVVPVRPLVVVWGHVQSPLPDEVDGVKVVHGTSLIDHLRGLAPAGIDRGDIDDIAAVLDTKADEWDESEARRAPRVSLLIELGAVEILSRISQGVAGGVGGLFGAALVARWLQPALGTAASGPLAILLLIAAGIVMRRTARLAWAGLGVVTAGIGVLVAVGVTLAVHGFVN